jgi:hypothetical protein
VLFVLIKLKGKLTMNENENAKAYELRRLTADDVFPMFQIISKIGIKEFKACFESPEVMQMIKDAASNEKAKDDVTASVGMKVAFDLAGIVVSNLASCKGDIYQFLAQLSGKTVKDIGALPMMTFFEMIIDVIKKEEFKDFFQVVAKLLK